MNAWRVSSYSASGQNCIEMAGPWKTSSRSGGNGGNCVEMAGPWVTSSYSGPPGNDCVEVVRGHVVRVQDTKDRARGMLTVSGRAWEGFIEGQKL